MTDSYDQTPYRSIPYPQTRPAHLAAVAHLLGIAAPAVATARVLEIGCAGGGNLIPLAAAFPDGRFIGIDPSAVQIEQARQRAAAAGLGNIDFRPASVTDVDQAWGGFDYVVCHGVYSWVPAEIRRAILRVIAERLSDDGLAVVSYNVLPGWHLKRVARDVMLTHAAQFDDPAEKLGQARAFLDFVRDHAPRETPYGQVVLAERAFLAEHRDDYVLHDYLEADNRPCTVMEFLAEAGSAGLGYLADSDTMLPETVDSSVAAALRQLAGDRLPRLEHYLDLVIGRTFRQSILMKPAALVARRTFDPARLAGLQVSIADGSARTVNLESAEAEAALAALRARWPNSVTAAEFPDDALFELMQEGLLALSTVPIRVGGAEVTHPAAWPLARADAVRGATETANPQHMPVELDAASRALLPFIDGTRDRAALAGYVMMLVQRGTITLRHEGKPIDDPAQLRALVDRIVEGAIRSLASAGLLTA